VILVAVKDMDDDRIVCDFCPDTEKCTERTSWIFEEQIVECETKGEPSYRPDEEFIDEAIAGGIPTVENESEPKEEEE
jgi:hypothetical protein